MTTTAFPSRRVHVPKIATGNRRALLPLSLVAPVSSPERCSAPTTVQGFLAVKLRGITMQHGYLPLARWNSFGMPWKVSFGIAACRHFALLFTGRS
jgi:hypothetical protein